MHRGNQAKLRGEDSISVILPTYNRASLLPRSMDSVLAQSFENFELIVIDDGSEDHTSEVVRGYIDRRVRYLKLHRNRGLSAARNAGLAEARGAYLAFQDSDDEWHHEKLERQLHVIQDHPDVAVVYSDMCRQFSDGRRMYLRSPDIVRGRLVNPQTHFWQTYMLAMQPAMVRRACVDGMQFDEKLALFEDLDFHLRLAMDHEYVHIKEPLVTYHETLGMTANRPMEFKARRQLVCKHRKSVSVESTGFLFCETANIIFRRSLMPIVRQHLEPL